MSFTDSEKLRKKAEEKLKAKLVKKFQQLSRI